MRADRRLIASARGRAFLLGLEFCDRGADRRERPVFVLLLAKAVRIRPLRRVHPLFQKIRKVLVEASFFRPPPGYYVSRNIPSLLLRKPQGQGVGSLPPV